MTNLAFRGVSIALASLAITSFAAAQGSGSSVTITQPINSSGESIGTSEPLVIHDPYNYAAHFVVRRLRLSGQGPTITVRPGATVRATLEQNVHCTNCATPNNHLIVGFAGQQSASTCSFSGGRESNGWSRGQFSIVAPTQPGIYPIRIAIASTGETACDANTLGYWTRTNPRGPDADATIGVLIVEGPRPTTGSTTTTTTTTATTTQSTPALSNGGFENPDVPTGQAIVMASLPGWERVAGSGVSVHDNHTGRANGGSQFVELDGNDSSGIATNIATVAGREYLVSLAFAARPGTGVGDNKLEVRWNGAHAASVEGTGEGHAHANWTRMSFRVRATGATSRIELRDAGVSNGAGTYVDDVSIVPVD